MDKVDVARTPNERARLSVKKRSGYAKIRENWQLKYGDPPPDWEGPPPGKGCEIYIGRIPRDCYEDELVPAFERIGKIYQLRLMMAFSGCNRGFGFVMYTNRQDSLKAVREMNNFEIREGRPLAVLKSVDNCRIFLGGIQKTITKEEILREMNEVTDGVIDVIVYPSATDKSKNRGFAFVEYESHAAAAIARRKLIPGRFFLLGRKVAVDWAVPEQELDEDIMSKVKILFVRNLMLSTTAASIYREFSNACGNEDMIVEIKKLTDCAFVHFRDRDMAIKAMTSMNGAVFEGSRIEVVLAKPLNKARCRRYAKRLSQDKLLEDVCQQNAWGSPIYQLHSTMRRDREGYVELFLYKITIPALIAITPHFVPDKLCRTVDGAKIYSSKFVLQQLGIPTGGQF